RREPQPRNSADTSRNMAASRTETMLPRKVSGGGKKRNGESARAKADLENEARLALLEVTARGLSPGCCCKRHSSVAPEAAEGLAGAATRNQKILPCRRRMHLEL